MADLHRGENDWFGTINIPTIRQPSRYRDQPKRKFFLAALLVFFFAGAAFVLVRNSGWGFNAVLLTITALTLVALFIGLFSSEDTISRGRVRYALNGPLTFLPNYRGWMWALIVGCGVTAIAMLGLASHFLPGVEPIVRVGRRSAIVVFALLAIAGPWLFVRSMTALLRSRIVVSPQGVTWVHGFRTAQIPFDQIIDAGVSGGYLHVVTNLETFKASVHAFSTAPEVIAHALIFFTKNPQRRLLLNTPTEALTFMARTANE